MFTGTLLCIITGLTWSAIACVRRHVAKNSIPIFKFYCIGNSIACVICWIYYLIATPNASFNHTKLLPIIIILVSVGIINSISEAINVNCFKYGHNGITVAASNSSIAIPFIYSLVFLHEHVAWQRCFGLVLLLSSLFIMVTQEYRQTHSKRNNIDLKKPPLQDKFIWLILLMCRIIFTGTILTLIVISSKYQDIEAVRNMRIPLVMSACAIGNGVFSQFKFISSSNKIDIKKVFKISLIWVVFAITSYYFQFLSVDTMASLGSSAVVYPLMVCAYLSSFSLYSHLKLKEPYNVFSIISLIMCVGGIFLLSTK